MNSDKSNKNIAVVDDDDGMRRFIKRALQQAGYTVYDFESAYEALDAFKRMEFFAAVLDIRMPGMDGLTLINELKSINSQIHILMVTAYGSIENAVESMRRGAFDYLTKPFEADELLLKLGNIELLNSLQIENQILKLKLDESDDSGTIIGSSLPIKTALASAAKIAKTKQKVLILGESGTGKELLARFIHNKSDRAGSVFLTIECGALSPTLMESELFGHAKGSFTGSMQDREGLIEAANGGTVFFDEIGDIDASVQARLLRVIQEGELKRVGENKVRKVDIRFLFATNKNMVDLVKKEKFREDLYYRIAGFTITLPPLRERREDIPSISLHALEKYNLENKSEIFFQSDIFSLLIAKEWKGNIRELKNTIEAAAAIAEKGSITSADIMFVMQDGVHKEGSFATPHELINSEKQFSKILAETKEFINYKKAKAKILNDFEKSYLTALETIAGTSITRQSELAGIDKKNLYLLQKKHLLR